MTQDESKEITWIVEAIENRLKEYIEAEGNLREARIKLGAYLNNLVQKAKQPGKE